MSDHVLPDDPRDWPQDPFELLGVPDAIDEGGLRRAYTRLIRRYKPEQAPDEFQKIRQAFESARQQLPWRSRIRPPQEEEADDEDPELSQSPLGDSRKPIPDEDANPEQRESGGNTRPTPLPNLRLSRDPLRDARDAWRRARTGEWHTAWRRLRQLELQQPDSDEILKRLHWLQRLRPELAGEDGSSEREEAPPRVPRTHTLRALFLDRMRQSFDVACSPEAEAWWSVGTSLSPWERFSFLRARWSTFPSRGLPGFLKIESDLERASELFADGRPFWFQTLVHVIELTYLGQGDETLPLRKHAQELLSRERDLELEYSFLLERLDLVRDLEEIRVGVVASRERRLIGLALRGFVGRDLDVRDELLAELAAWDQSPTEGLDLVDQLGSRHPACLTLLRDLVVRYAEERAPDSDTAEPERLAALLAEERDLIASLRRFSRSPIDADNRVNVRWRLLMLCLRERVRLGSLVEALRQLPASTIDDIDTLCGALEGDAALVTVTEGCLALWHS